MKKSILLLSLVLYGFSLAQNSSTVSVLAFDNQSGSSGMNYLSTALADSIASGLNERGITLVERQQIEKILEENSLQMSGLIEQNQSIDAIALSAANVLVMGSYTGSVSELRLNVKAVAVSNGSVIIQRTLESNLENIFDQAHAFAALLAPILKGESLASLSIISSPDNAEVYVNDMYVGKTPLLKVPVVQGSNSVRVFKSGYVDQQKTFNTLSGEERQWDVFLPEAGADNQTEVYYGLGLILPKGYDGFNQDMSAFFGITSTFKQWYLQGSYDLHRSTHDQRYEGFDQVFESEQYFAMHFMGIGVGYRLFPNRQNFNVTLGAQGGYALSLLKVPTSANSEETTTYTTVERFDQHFYYGTHAEIHFFPLANYTIFIKAHFQKISPTISSLEYEANLFGPRSENPVDIDYYELGYSLGLRVKRD